MPLDKLYEWLKQVQFTEYELGIINQYVSTRSYQSKHFNQKLSIRDYQSGIKFINESMKMINKSLKIHETDTPELKKTQKS